MLGLSQRNEQHSETKQLRIVYTIEKYDLVHLLNLLVKPKLF